MKNRLRTWIIGFAMVCLGTLCAWAKAVTTFPDGRKVHVLLMDKSSSLWIPMDCEITYTPAQIGGVPVSYVYYRDLQ